MTQVALILDATNEILKRFTLNRPRRIEITPKLQISPAYIGWTNSEVTIDRTTHPAGKFRIVGLVVTDIRPGRYYDKDPVPTVTRTSTNEITELWSYTAWSQQQIDDYEAARINSEVEDITSRQMGKFFLEVTNRIRALEGLGPITGQQLKNYVRNL